MLLNFVKIVSACSVSCVAAFCFQDGQPSTAGNVKQVSARSGLAEWEKKEVQEFLGYESCRKCHQQQIQVLVSSQHFRSYETLHRQPAAKEMCKQLGIRSVKRSERCVRCHFTPEETKRGIKAQSGISCESCHGPAEQWIKGHNDYGGLTITRETETPEHRQLRIRNSIDSGMRHPSNLYLLAKSCYDCHLVADSELVNKTAHPHVSSDFNMVSWSQGSLRHNFLRTDGIVNGKSSPERLRVMFVAELLARMEHILEAKLDVESGTRFEQALSKEWSNAVVKLTKIEQLVRNDWVSKSLEAAAQVKPDSSGELLQHVADYLSQAAFDFAKNEEVHRLEAIQPMLPEPSQYR